MRGLRFFDDLWAVVIDPEGGLGDCRLRMSLLHVAFARRFCHGHRPPLRHV